MVKYPARKISKTRCQIAIRPVNKRFIGEVAILTENNLAQTEVAHHIRCEIVPKLVQVDYVPERFRHLPPI